MASLHSIRAALAAALLALPRNAAAQSPVAVPQLQETAATNFAIFLRGTPLGTEQIALNRVASGWTIVSTGRLGAPIDAIARRVLTLAKVFDHLLGAGLTRTIDFGGYLSSLCDAFKDMENSEHSDITLTCRGKSLMLDLDTATPLGLVVAELISNSYLHAFQDGVGTISISLQGGKPGGEAREVVVSPVEFEKLLASVPDEEFRDVFGIALTNTLTGSDPAAAK